MIKKRKQEFFTYFIPLIEVLKELGGSGKSSEVTDLVIEKLNIPEEVLEETIKSGTPRVRHYIARARNYLVKSGHLDSSQRAVWSLTPKGIKSNLKEKDIYDIYLQTQGEMLLKYDKHEYVIPLIEVLKDLGGSGKVAEVTDLVIKNMNISEERLNEILKSGTPKVRNQIAWIRNFLVVLGIMDSSKRGIWALTKKGLEIDLKHKDIYSIIFPEKSQTNETAITEENIVQNRNDLPNEPTQPIEIEPDEYLESEEDGEEEIDELNDYKIELIGVLRALPPEGFERICQRLLREAGFEQVTVTGRSNDGGIDGHGIYQENDFVSARVLFQCKRYKGSVSPSQIRDFRGAMIGRADKGIILTTGTFTLNAKKEARRVLPMIELIDGEKLVGLFEKLKLGLIPKMDYDVDYKFFNDFR